uniref:Uncharacterized protein n=1 Tax=Cyprinus carpio TaxID=7962 RepID=A0A8C1LWT8_CYPCA
MGSKAMSHDSVFVSDSPSSETNEGLGASQDSIHGKVKSLQYNNKFLNNLDNTFILIIYIYNNLIINCHN